MRKHLFYAAILLTVALVACQNGNMKREAYAWPEGVTPPVAIKKPRTFVQHGDTLLDDYYWMNDYFKKGPDSSLVVEYLNAENAYLDTMMSGTKAFQEKLIKEMRGRIQERDESVPVISNGYTYYTKTREGQQYYQYYRKSLGAGGKEELLLDVDKMAEGKGYFSVTGLAVSPDNQWLAYGVDELSRRQYTIHFKNLTTGEILSESIPGTGGNAVWSGDSKYIFYTANHPVTLLSEKIRRHQLNSPADQDVTIYTETDPTNYIYVSKSRSDRFILITSAGTQSSESRFLSADDPTGTLPFFNPA